METKYHLSPQVFACLSGRHCMFLDLQRDSYFSVPREDIEALTPWIQNWSLTRCGPSPSTPPPDSTVTLAAELLRAGILTERAPTTIELPHRAAAAAQDLASISPEAQEGGSVRPFFLATTALSRASWELQTASISRIVRAVQKTKYSAAISGPTDCNEAARLTAAFLKIRPFFPRNYCCLFDSLALLRFLSGFQLFPDWVFAVQADPFNAHCWVQAGTLVLNDHLDHVCGFTPIMTV